MLYTNEDYLSAKFYRWCIKEKYMDQIRKQNIKSPKKDFYSSSPKGEIL